MPLLPPPLLPSWSASQPPLSVGRLQEAAAAVAEGGWWSGGWCGWGVGVGLVWAGAGGLWGASVGRDARDEENSLGAGEARAGSEQGKGDEGARALFIPESAEAAPGVLQLWLASAWQPPDLHARHYMLQPVRAHSRLRGGVSTLMGAQLQLCCGAACSANGMGRADMHAHIMQTPLCVHA